MASAKGARYADIIGRQRLAEGQEQVFSELGKGYDAASGYLGQAGGLYQGMAAQGQPGIDKHNALTLGSGTDIQNAIEGLGSYQWNKSQGLEALARQHAAAGSSSSGNADTDAMSFASGLASNTLGQERQALMPYFDLYKSGTQGEATGLGAQAGLATDYFGNRASTIDNNTKASIELTTGALKAGDAAKTANQQMILGGAQLGAQLLGSVFGGGGGGFMPKK